MTSVFEPHWVQQPGTRVGSVARPATIADALVELAADPTKRLVAGGTDLVLELARTPGPDVDLIDLSGIEGFGSITVDGGELVLAGGVTHNDVVADARVVQGALALAQACLEIGSPQLRNRATIAGNLATASPANDSISALMALGASVELSSLAGSTRQTRLVAVADFFDGFRSTVLTQGELITAIRVPLLGPAARGIWVKAGLRKAQAISVVHAGLVIEFVDDDPTAPVADARIALGSVAATVVLSEPARHALVGRVLDDRAIEAAARAAAAGVTPIDDGRASAEYRLASVETVVSRGLRSVRAGTEAATWPDRVPTLRSDRAGSDPNRAPRQELVDDGSEIAVEINGTAKRGSDAARLTLLDWLREHAGTGTKEGCAEGECGACTVMLDGEAVMSCLTPAAQADGSSVTTVEGLAAGSDLSAMQQSFVDNFAVQCGYCIPGFVVSASALRDEIDAPTRDEIEFGLAGNLCRRTGYYAIIEAVRAAGRS